MTFYATLEEALAAKSLGRSFGTHLTQPRDDIGRWTSGGGTLNAAHVATVLKAEGIHESRHAEVLSKVNKEHTTRAQVLAHINAIHASAAGKPAPKQIQDAREAVADAHAKNARAIRSEDDYASHVSESQKDADLKRELAYAEEIRAGKHDGNFTIRQRLEYHMTGRSTPFLPPGLPKKSIEDMNDNTLVAFGGGIKMLAETEHAWRIGGWLVVHDSHDVSSLRDKFLKSTDYDFEDGETRTLYYNHGLDGTLKKTKLGRVELTLKDAGVWYEGEVKKRKDYLAAHVEKIAQGIKDGIYGASSGVPAHLVERKSVDGGHIIEMWPISEASITPTPAEPLTSCLSLKSLQELEESEEAKGFNPDQPRDEDGRFGSGSGGASSGQRSVSNSGPQKGSSHTEAHVTINGQQVEIKGHPVGAKTVAETADRFNLSAGAKEVLLDAHAEGKIKTDDHLLRAIEHGKQRDNINGHPRAQHYADGAELHGAGGSAEGRSVAVNPKSVGAKKTLAVEDFVNVPSDEEAKGTSEINNAGLHDGLAFEDESETVLAANTDFLKRLSDLYALRASSRKSGRVFSRAKLATIAEHRDSLSQLMDAMDAMRGQLADWIEEHGDGEAEMAGKSQPASTSQNAMEAVLAFELHRARAAGVNA